MSLIQRPHRIAIPRKVNHPLTEFVINQSEGMIIVGFMNHACQFMGFRFEGAATSETTILCFEALKNDRST